MSISPLDVHMLKMAQQLGQGGHGGERKKRGAVIAKGNKVIATGTSTHLGGNLFKPEVEEERYVATVNAEVVALAGAVQAKASLNETTIYISDSPNWLSFKFLVTLGIKRIVHYGVSTNERLNHYARELGVQVISIG